MKKVKLVFLSLLVIFLVMTQHKISYNNAECVTSVETICSEKGGGGVIYPPPIWSPRI